MDSEGTKGLYAGGTKGLRSHDQLAGRPLGLEPSNHLESGAGGEG